MSMSLLWRNVPHMNAHRRRPFRRLVFARAITSSKGRAQLGYALQGYTCRQLQEDFLTAWRLSLLETGRSVATGFPALAAQPPVLTLRGRFAYSDHGQPRNRLPHFARPV